MGKITRNELSEVLTEELDATSEKQGEILNGVNGIKVDTTAIKSDTAAILANFPISGGTNWDDLTTIVTKSGLSVGGNGNIVLEVNGSGYLFSITGSYSPTSTTNMQVELFIDGKHVTGIEQRHDFTCLLKFNTSLVVRWYGSASASNPSISYALI